MNESLPVTSSEMKSAAPSATSTGYSIGVQQSRLCGMPSPRYCMCAKPAMPALLARPLQDGVGVLVPDLVRFGEPEGQHVAPQGLVGVLRVHGVPVPFRIPVDEPARGGDRVVLPGHQRQVGPGVLDLAIAHVGQEGDTRQVVDAHLGLEARHGFRGAPAAPVDVRVARVPAGGLGAGGRRA